MIPTTDLRMAARTGMLEDPAPRNLYGSARPPLTQIARAAWDYHFLGDDTEIRKLFDPVENAKAALRYKRERDALDF